MLRSLHLVDEWTTPLQAPFVIRPRLLAEHFAPEYARHGCVRIAQFLTAPCAAKLHEHLEADGGWTLRRRRRDVFKPLPGRARQSLQYACETREALWDDESGNAASLLAHFAAFVRSEVFLELMRNLTGHGDITTADAEATRHGPGHFLQHYDEVTEHDARRAAYVLNLTPGWEVDWGGMLQFTTRGGEALEARVPRFNTLDVFELPRFRAVTPVAAHAAAHCYSIAGWLCAR